MTAILCAVQGCVSGQRDWRRITLGTDGGGNNIGFATFVGYGSIPAGPQKQWKGANITNLLCTAAFHGNACEIIFDVAGMGATPFDGVEFIRPDGKSLILRPSDAGFIYGTGGGFSQYDWNPLLPGQALPWVAGDVGKTVGFGIF